MNINQSVAKKVLETVDAGLVEGMGEPTPGMMCIEAAVCFAMGLEHSDNPPCVGNAVRTFKIALNDSRWSTNAARAKGMRKLAIAQLGSNEIDQIEFVKKLSEQTIKILIPKLFRKTASSLVEEYQLLEAADRCEQEGTVEAARAAAAADADAVADAAYAAARAADAACAAYAAAGAAARAAAGAGAAARAAARAARSSTAGAAAGVVGAARAARSSAAACAAYAYDDADDEFLILSADIALNVLIEMKSPGCEFLHLCD